MKLTKRKRTVVTKGLFKKIKTTKKNTHEFFKVPIKIASIFHDSEIWFYCFVFYFLGIPKLKIPPLEPFLIPETSIDRRTNSLDVKATMTQLAIMGVNSVIFSKLK